MGRQAKIVAWLAGSGLSPVQRIGHSFSVCVAYRHFDAPGSALDTIFMPFYRDVRPPGRLRPKLLLLLSIGRLGTSCLLPPGLPLLYYTIEHRKYEMNSGCDLTQFFAAPAIMRLPQDFSFEHKVGIEGGACIALV